MDRPGLEGWLRAHGIRPGPVYTLVQIAVVLLAMAIGALLFAPGHW
jgi:hypothetical protein